METKQIKPCIVVISLIATTIIIIMRMGEPIVSGEGLAGIQLPVTVEGFTSHGILNCQNPHCRFAVLDNNAIDTCPKCNNALHAVSYVEKLILPKDTIIQKRGYSAGNGASFTVSLVLSGKERTSIHRPQMCLPSQGYKIIKQYVREIPAKKDTSFEISILDIQRENNPSQKAFFAYWFVSNTHETPYHLQRMFWTAFDNIFKNTSEQWAYISIMASGGDHSEDSLRHLCEFAKQFRHAMKHTTDFDQYAPRPNSTTQIVLMNIFTSRTQPLFRR